MNGVVWFSGKIMATLSYARTVGIKPRPRKEKGTRRQLTMNRRHSMGRILDTVPSSSNPGKTYDIIEGKDGVIYCTCTAWKMRKTCKHLKEWHQKNNLSGMSYVKDKPNSLDEVVSTEVQKLLCK